LKKIISTDLFQMEFKSVETGSEEKDILTNKSNENTITGSLDLDEPEDSMSKLPNEKKKAESEDDDIYLSTNDLYQITSNYDYLAELSNSQHTSTLVKPFLVCIEKLFNVLAKKLNMLDKDEGVYGMFLSYFIYNNGF
jgi:hypothetical protein